MSENTAVSTANPFAPLSAIDRASGRFKRREFYILLLAVAFQVLVLVAMIIRSAMPLVIGDTVLLRVASVGPRDHFRGDYVVLSYDFSRGLPGGIEGLPGAYYTRSDWQGRTVYVSLVPEADGRHWRTDKISIHCPSSGKYLRGTITNQGRIECGIESLYVQEGTGHEYYEAAVRNRKLAAEVSVTSHGQATLRALKIE